MDFIQKSWNPKIKVYRLIFDAENDSTGQNDLNVVSALSAQSAHGPITNSVIAGGNIRGGVNSRWIAWSMAQYDYWSFDIEGNGDNKVKSSKPMTGGDFV